MRNNLLMICMLSIIVGCNKTKDTPIIIEEIEEIIDENAEAREIITPYLFEKLEEFTKEINIKNEIQSKKNKLESRVVLVFFEQDADECFLYILKSNIYISRYIKGYTILNGLMIEFSSLIEGCNIGFIDESKMRKGLPTDYPDEFSKEANYDYSHYGKKYKVHSRDSLEVVSTGYF